MTYQQMQMQCLVTTHHHHHHSPLILSIYIIYLYLFEPISKLSLYSIPIHNIYILYLLASLILILIFVDPCTGSPGTEEQKCELVTNVAIGIMRCKEG
jgi:hypothetical protein